MVLTKRQLRDIWASDRKKEKRGQIIAVLLVIAVFAVCMCFRYDAFSYPDKFVPIAHLKSFFYAIKWFITGESAGLSTDAMNDLIASVGLTGYYGSAFGQLKMIGMGLIAGMALPIAGAIFQTAYRNPMASPNMIGATAGVTLGNILVVSMFSYLAYEHIVQRYAMCYGFSAICVAVTIILGKIAGDKRENISVMEMVMVGAVASQLINVVSMYIMYNMDDEDLLIYEEIQMGTYSDTELIGTVIFFTAMIVSLTPILAMRYRLNVLSMDKMETTSLGINAGPLRLIAQICGALMVTTAMVHCGEIGMVSMVVPLIVRSIVGGDFRKVCLYSGAAGGILLMLCRLAVSFFRIAGEQVPVGFVINLVLMPAFLVILAKRGGVRFENRA